MLKKMENNVGARTHPCLTPFEMGKLSDRDPLCFTCTLMTYMELAEDNEKWGGGVANARQDILQSITADRIKGLGQVYKSSVLCISPVSA